MDADPTYSKFGRLDKISLGSSAQYASPLAFIHFKILLFEAPVVRDIEETAILPPDIFTFSRSIPRL